MGADILTLARIANRGFLALAKGQAQALGQKGWHAKTVQHQHEYNKGLGQRSEP